MSIFSEAWSLTMKDAKRGATNWLRRHPTTNLLAWGGATLVWTLPKRGLSAYHRAHYRPRVTVSGSKRAPMTISSTETVSETVTVESEVIGPKGGGKAKPKAKSTTSSKCTTTTTTTTTTATTTATGVMHMPNTARVLGRTDLARSWAQVIDQVTIWGPVIDAEATSVVAACNDMNASAGHLAAAVDDLNTMFVLSNFDKRLLGKVRTAALCLMDASGNLASAGKEAARVHADQLSQEATGVPMARRPGAALIAGAGDVPLQTLRPARAVALHVGAFMPEFGEVIASTGAHLMVNKWALGLWGNALDELADRLGGCGVHRQVCAKLRGAADDLRSAGVSLHAAVQLLGRLYSAQAAAESSGATVTPIR